MTDTIFATSSGRPPAAIAVIRISGPDALGIAQALAGRLPPPRRAGLRRLRDCATVLDDALVLVFPGTASATGEDVVELHCHGGRAVVAAVERALAAQPGARPAQAGEFTRRALMNGRIDMAEAQGLADLLAAETEMQRIAAIGAAEGAVSRAIGGWLDRIATLGAQLEAALDFAEEDDLADDPALVTHVGAGMRMLAAEMAAVLEQPAVDRLRDGIRVVLAGPPNSGKSTLLNRMAEREAAIVSAISGTTRDRIEVPVARAGLPFVLTDTAGLTRSDDAIERIGVERARASIEEADLLLWLGDTPPPRADALWIHARADLPERTVRPQGPALSVADSDAGSIYRLWEAVTAAAAAMIPRTDRFALSEAQREQCRAAREALVQPWRDPLIGAELLRQGHSSLAGILGHHATERMLDALFSRFCIGK